MSGLCGSFAQVWTQWSYSGAERKIMYPLERWSYSKQTPERIIRGENVIQPSEPIIGFTFQVWAKKQTSHDHVCFVLWDARSCYVCTRFCTCQSTSVLQRSKTKHHIFFILLLLFYCSSPTEEANEQTKHSHIVCSDTFWLDVHRSQSFPQDSGTHPSESEVCALMDLFFKSWWKLMFLNLVLRKHFAFLSFLLWSSS